MSKSVLIIEDEPHILEALNFLLSKEGYLVSSHNDGNDAVEKAKAVEPDLFILDLMLPHKNGFEIFDDLRRIPKFTKTPVLMLTAKGQAKDRGAAELAGVDLFMTKPFSNREVIENVNKLLST